MGIPKTSDGKPIFLPNLFPGNVFLYITGVGDTANAIGDGTEFTNASNVAGTTTTEWQFRDWVYLSGGTVITSDAVFGDKISMMLYAPASTVSANVGNTGNCNLYALGGGKNMVLPAAGNGAYDLVSGVPVPSYDEGNGEIPDGYWDWSNPDTGLGTLSAAPNEGGYNLFDFPVNLVSFIKNIPLIGTGPVNIPIPAIKPKKVLPHWKFKVSLVNSGNSNLKVGWFLVTARRTTL